MRRISYAGEAVITTDEVASVLVDLSAALARIGQAEAIRIPILTEGGPATAELVVGIGNDVLSVPHSSDDAEPEFTPELKALRARLERVAPTIEGDLAPPAEEPDAYDPDLDISRG
ncbi:hypothetical protein ACTU3I_11230 [Microbacterium sp. RD1]|uniref:hypothetical protein n=1 Tax=Microbacterium sp. RD1 TaxID=3457313 RepID=UPI003FA582FF